MTEDEFEKLQDLKGLTQGCTGQSATESGQKADFPIIYQASVFYFVRGSQNQTNKQKRRISGALNFKSFVARPPLCSQN